jgi:hypothetical protein
MKEQLAQLGFVGIQEPASVSWWPLAIGWWIVIAIIIGLALILYRLTSNKTAKPAPPVNYRKWALEELNTIEANYNQHVDNPLLAQEISQLLRRIVITESDAPVAGLTGDQWLNALDVHFQLNEHFLSSTGKVLTESAYNPNAFFDGNALIQLTHQALIKSYKAVTQEKDDA